MPRVVVAMVISRKHGRGGGERTEITVDRNIPN
jgi:hypothetical protein